MSENNLHNSESREKGTEALPASVRIRRGAVRMMHDAFSGIKDGMKEPDAIKGLTGLIAYGPVALVGMFGRLIQYRYHAMVRKGLHGDRISNMGQYVLGEKPEYKPIGGGQAGQAGGPTTPQG